MSNPPNWPNVDTDKYGYLICPIGICAAELRFDRTYSIVLDTDRPDDVRPEHAASSGWQVECTNGHVLHTDVDQIRLNNAEGLTDDDETGDHAPELDLLVLLRRLHSLRV